MVLRAPSRPQSEALDICPLYKLVQPPYRRFAPMGGMPLYKKHIGVVWQIFNILRKKGEIKFRIGAIR
jgi:hypothetical protein